MLFKLTLAPDELLELLLVGVEKLEPRMGFLQLLRGLLKGGLEDLVVSESLGHLADLLVFELKNLEYFSILSFLSGPLMLHCFCQQLL